MSNTPYSANRASGFGTNGQRVQVRRVEPGASTGGGEASPLDARAEAVRDLALAKLFASWMDAKFEVAGIRFGLDSIVGLIPGVGDAAGVAAGLFIPYLAQKHNLGAGVLARMVANLAIDALPSSIPVLGDLFDVAFKANLRNVALLEKELVKKYGVL